MSLAIPLMVVASALIAYALVFWTPWFRTSSGNWVTISATPHFDEWGTGQPFTKGYAAAVPGGFGEVGGFVDVYPDVTQEVLNKVFEQFARMENHQLYVLKHYDDVCDIDTIECHGLTSKQAKPLIEAALAHRQTLETATISWRGLYIAAGSLFVGLFSLGIAALTFLTRKKA